jgi:hypothetical protein
MSNVTIDNSEYNVDDLNDVSKHCIARIQEYDRKVNMLQLEIKEIKIITDNYLDTLRKEIKDAKSILQQDSQTEGDPEKKN